MSTMITASASAFMKVPTAALTMRGWSDTFLYSMPIGRSRVIAAIAASRFSPSFKTSPSRFIDTASAIAGLPPRRIVCTGGST